ncbi:MAG TPA: TraR/DksA C4-type zinc finger protein [Nitrospira sp.]|nr:TraR/DksA C4-type zinc finger protein [Nitrospira sp.]
MKTGKSSKRTTRRRAVTAKRDGKPAGAGSKYGAIRRELEKQRQAILDEVGEGLTKREGPEAFPDVSDQASAEVDQNFSMRIKEREQKLLKKIDEALDRLNKNIYGICERCEEEIPYQRLKARPVTTLCIACKTLQEQEEKFRG